MRHMKFLKLESQTSLIVSCKLCEAHWVGMKTTLKTRTDGEADPRHRDLVLSRDDMRAVDIVDDH